MTNEGPYSLLSSGGYDINDEPSEIHFLARVIKESVKPHWRDEVDVLLRDFVKENITIALKTRSNVLRQDFLGTKIILKSWIYWRKFPSTVAIPSMNIIIIIPIIIWK